MTSRERVKRAILFQKPDRIPFDLPQPWGSDFLWVVLPEEPVRKYIFNGLKYISAQKTISQNTEDKFFIAKMPLGFISMVESLRGYETAWTDAHLYPQEFEKLLDKVTEIILESIENFSKLGVDPVRSRKCHSDISVTEVPKALPTSNEVDGVLFLDDWGLQDRLIINPDLWRKFWKPRYKKIFHFAHEKGLLTFLHSCGYIIDILGDLIEAELDVIQMDQQENMGVEKLSELLGGKICFWCPVDIQNTMVKGSVEDVKNSSKKLIESFGKFNGGFIAKWYPSPEAVNHSKEKIQAMAETFVNYGKDFYGKQ